MKTDTTQKYYVYIHHTEVAGYECGHSSPDEEIKVCKTLQEAYNLWNKDPKNRMMLKNIAVRMTVEEVSENQNEEEVIGTPATTTAYEERD